MASAQDNDEVKAITARVHGTFQDKAGGLGVLSGDMTVVRFEVRNGTVTAVGEIVGALADSRGDVLGHVNQELAMPVGNVTSSCNQLRMDLAATDSEVLQTIVHFDKEAAGFDSRDGATPRALGGVVQDRGAASKPGRAGLAGARAERHCRRRGIKTGAVIELPIVEPSPATRSRLADPRRWSWDVPIATRRAADSRPRRPAADRPGSPDP